MPDSLSAGRGLLRRLVYIRWIAATGQLSTLLVVRYGLQFPLDLPPCLLIASLPIVINLLMPVYKRGQRVRARDALLFLGFDVAQLSAMLAVTGGLANPFALLILGPVAVAAGLLPRRHAVVLTVFAVVCICGLALPVDRPSELVVPLALPPLYLFGMWVALVIASCSIAAYNWTISYDVRRAADALAATQAALAKEQRWSDLGALAAAAAHELGSPLSTIAVVVRELTRELPPDSPFAEDIALLQSQSDRCRDILAELSRSPEQANAPFEVMPLPMMLEGIADPYKEAGIRFQVTAVGRDGSDPPIIRRSPELVHGLGNILQNAMQFAASLVQANVSWSSSEIRIEIHDDGPGFPPGLLARVGEPYVSGRRPGEEHLGLGVFIALTLLERTGAMLDFANAEDGGAIVTCLWRRSDLDGKKEGQR
jgi:two-component system sensor histidine kinase RegB